MKRLVLAALLLLPLMARAADLPAAIAASSALRIANVPNYPPLEFLDLSTNRLTGFDIDLGDAIAARLGLKAAWVETSFDQMLPGLATGRVDAVMSGMSDLATRHETASFVDYLRSGPQFFVSASRAGEFKDMTALCGKTVGASRRTAFPKQIMAWSDEHCPGKPITFIGTDGSIDARTQLRQGRLDAAVQGNETMPFVMEQEPNQYATVGGAIATQLTGIALPVKETGLQQAILSALDALIADGTYKTLLAKWHLADNAVTKADLNAGQ